MKREIRRVQEGLDPVGTIRDPQDHVLIDTKLMESIAQMARSRGPRAVNE
jgi:hypothetical protein